MPRVRRLTIAPVRSRGLESRDEIFLTPDGVAEVPKFTVAPIPETRFGVFRM